jgi:hypothetical protein
MDLGGPSSSIEADGGGDKNALILSLYLIESEEDILPSSTTTDGVATVKQRARLYTRLCEACTIANVVLQSAASTITSKTTNNNQLYRPWSSGGDGPLFGIHCDSSYGLNGNGATNGGFDADDVWQSQSPPSTINGSKSNTKRTVDEYLGRQTTHTKQHQSHHQPHLRAICQYGNDINDLWRCIYLALQISSKLSFNQLQCAIECWDRNDGHILLIEAAEHLPSWVDDDVLQGGVGGPGGCRNRCWLMNGEVHLIPRKDRDTITAGDGSGDTVDRLDRRDALCALMESAKYDGGSMTVASESVQSAIRGRIERTSYAARCNNETESKPSNSHWHVAAAALPASVAHFVQKHPSLVPLLVDSFCKHAPVYLNQKGSSKKEETDCNSVYDAYEDDTPQEKGSNNKPVGTDKQTTPSATTLQPSTKNKETETLGTLFPYEQLVVLPIILTRTNYAELVTGRGIVPSFPIPSQYRSVELNRFQRQLRQTANVDSGEDAVVNPFQRAVDVGIRLCAGLDWVLGISCDDSSEEGDAVTNSLGELERRLRIYWTRIDAEASKRTASNASEDTDHASLAWIESTWQAGPNGCTDKGLTKALESMSKCRVYHPELSKSLWKEPCPSTRINQSLRDITQSGMKRALKWQRDEYGEGYFPMPRTWEVDSDKWMEVNSLEELETEMRKLSSPKATAEPSTGKSRRTTRRSRRNLAQSTVNQTNNDECNVETDHPKSKQSFPEDKQNEDVQSLKKMMDGFRSLVEGEGELEGVVTHKALEGSNPKEIVKDTEFAEQLMSKEVNINPRLFLNELHSMLHSNSLTDYVSGGEKNQEISKFFYKEDLEDGSMSDDSEDSADEEVGSKALLLSQLGNGLREDDPFSLKNIMVRVSVPLV